jgi:hypothetical protein
MRHFTEHPMKQDKKIIISNNFKSKYYGLVLSLVLLLASIYITIEFPFLLLVVVEIILLLPLSIVLLYLYVKRILRSTNYAIIVNDNGIFEDSNIISLGYIKWTEIKSVKRKRIYNEEVIVLIISTNSLKNYIDKEEDFLKKILMKINYLSCGTLVTIFERNIKFDIEKLYEIIIEKIANENKNSH